MTDTAIPAPGPAQSPVRLHDLAAPEFAPEVQEVLGLMASMAEACPLDPAALHEQARRETGLDDFGPRDYEERLALLCREMSGLRGLSAAGQVAFHTQLLQMLKNRLLLTDLLRREPAIHDVELLPPVVIAGMPRTGTTHLHNLMSSGGTFRTLPYWESLEPFPLPAEAGLEPDPRWARTEMAMGFMNQALPHFRLMHEMDTPEHVHEEIQLLANDFSTMFFETLADMPGWREHYCSHDQTPHYAYLRTTLKALQHLRGGRRWLLKSPQHLEQLPVLERVFPGVCVVITHRDPAHIVTSIATMIAYTERMHRDPVDPHNTGRVWADTVHRMLDALIRDRDAIPADRSMDLRFDDFMTDDLAAVEAVHEMAGEPLDARGREAMQTYLAEHERGRHGTVDYRPEDLGLDPDELRQRFAAYTERFLAPR